jgi:hypothetical protein
MEAGSPPSHHSLTVMLAFDTSNVQDREGAPLACSENHSGLVRDIRIMFESLKGSGMETWASEQIAGSAPCCEERKREERRDGPGRWPQYERLVLDQKKPKVLSMHALNVGVQMLADG